MAKDFELARYNLARFFRGEVVDTTVRQSIMIPAFNSYVHVRKWRLAELMRNSTMIEEWKEKNKGLIDHLTKAGIDWKKSECYTAFKMALVVTLSVCYEDGEPLFPKFNYDQVLQMMDAVGGHLIDRIYFDALVANELIDPTKIEVDEPDGAKKEEPPSPLEVAKKN